MPQSSEHFSKHELACKHCGECLGLIYIIPHNSRSYFWNIWQWHPMGYLRVDGPTTILTPIILPARVRLNIHKMSDEDLRVACIGRIEQNGSSIFRSSLNFSPIHRLSPRGVMYIIPECFVEQALLDALETFRSVVGLPVLIKSGYRCPEHNAHVGGSRNSQHVQGKAADVTVRGKTARELYDLALSVPSIKGLGVDDHHGYLHIDVRFAELNCLWCYSEAGKPVPFYDTKEKDKEAA